MSVLCVSGQVVAAAPDCAAYLDILKEYQESKAEFSSCGVAADSFLSETTLAEQKAWCKQATEADIEKRRNQTGFSLMQCRGTLHFYDFIPGEDSIGKNALISALFEEVTSETVPVGAFAAIKKNPGRYTAKDFGGAIDVNLFDPGNVNRSCELSAIQTELDDKPTTRHWLVTPTLACGRSRFAEINAPFWLVEESDQQFHVLLAYRAYILGIKKSVHQEYHDIAITYLSGDGNDHDINWQYQDGRYVYRSSRCTHLQRMDEDDPIYFTECAGTRGWR